MRLPSLGNVPRWPVWPSVPSGLDHPQHEPQTVAQRVESINRRMVELQRRVGLEDVPDGQEHAAE